MAFKRSGVRLPPAPPAVSPTASSDGLATCAQPGQETAERFEPSPATVAIRLPPHGYDGHLRMVPATDLAASPARNGPGASPRAGQPRDVPGLRRAAPRAGG